MSVSAQQVFISHYHIFGNRHRAGLINDMYNAAVPICLSVAVPALPIMAAIHSQCDMSMFHWHPVIYNFTKNMKQISFTHY